MRIDKHAVVTIDYTLKGDDGQELDRPTEGSPLTYVHGTGALVAGLEEALTGKRAGDAVTVRVTPEKGYGERDGALVGQVKRRQLGIEGDVHVGMQFRVDLEEGYDIVTVTGIDGDLVTIDANHPLAGRTLLYEVDVRDVREATAEEREQGMATAPRAE